MMSSVPVTVILSNVVAIALQAIGAGFDISMFLNDGCAQFFQSLYMQIDRTCANGAATWHRYASKSHACDQWSEHE
jgi:hypothetical protein